MVGAGRKRVTGHAGPGRRIHAQDGAVEASRVAGRAQVLAPERPTFRRGCRLRAARRHGRVPTGIEGRAVLPVVREVEARAVTAAHVQGAIGPERERADRVAGVLLAPVLDQHLLTAGHRVAGRLQPREPAADHASVSGRTWRRGARVPPLGCRRRVAEDVVVAVQDVDVRIGRKAGREGHAQQATVPEVVNVRAQVGEHRRRRVSERVEDLDDPALLGHEDSTVRRKPDDGRRVEAADDRGLLEPGGEGCRPNRRRIAGDRGDQAGGNKDRRDSTTDDGTVHAWLLGQRSTRLNCLADGHPSRSRAPTERDGKYLRRTRTVQYFRPAVVRARITRRSKDIASSNVRAALAARNDAAGRTRRRRSKRGSGTARRGPESPRASRARP